MTDVAKSFTEEEAEAFSSEFEELEKAKSDRIDAAILLAFEQVIKLRIVKDHGSFKYFFLINTGRT